MRAPPRQHHILLGPRHRRPVRRRQQCLFCDSCAGYEHLRCHSHCRRQQPFLRAPPRRHHILLGLQQSGTARQRTKRRKRTLASACAGHRHHRRHSHRRRPKAFLRAPPRRHHILLGLQRWRPARQRTNNWLWAILFGACEGNRHHRRHSHRSRKPAFLRAPPRQHHILLGERRTRQRSKRSLARACASFWYLRRYSYQHMRALLRAPPRQHHILLGLEPLWSARQRTKRKKR